MTSQEIIHELKASLEFFERSTRNLGEDDSAFRPADGMWTAAQQVGHVAQTLDWFIEGAKRPGGFDLDFDKHLTELASLTSLGEARTRLRQAFANTIRFFETASEADLKKPLPPGPVMGGEPLWHIAPAIVEHTAHHRGALTVYARLRGKIPPMPYMEM